MLGKGRVMAARSSDSRGRRSALALCAAVAAADTLAHLVRNRPAYAVRFAPHRLPLAAAGLAAAALLAAGRSATASVAMVGPAARWLLVSAWLRRAGLGLTGIATRVPALFAGGWLLRAFAAGAATRSYQLLSALPQGRLAPS
jgi:hypothetical protein